MGKAGGLLLGQTDDVMIEIKDGIREDEEVILNPRALLEEARREGNFTDPADEEDPPQERGGKSVDSGNTKRRAA